MKKIMVMLLNYAKKHHYFMTILRKTRYLLKRSTCLLYYFNKIDNNLIVFESFNGRKYCDSPKALYLSLLKDKKYNKYKFIWAFKNPSNYTFLESNRTKIVKYGSKEYKKAYGMCKYSFTTSRYPDYIKPKKNQVFVQCWHGTPLKKLGFDIEVSGDNALNNKKDIKYKYESDAKKYSYMVAPSQFVCDKYKSIFNLKKLNKDDIVITEGYPRNDYLYNYTSSDIKKIKHNLGINTNKKIILYAPTWRDNEHISGVGYTYSLNIDFDKFMNRFKDEYIVLFRTHYFISNSFDFNKYKGFVYDVSNYDDINDLYIISDLLITDYSSVFFDYANLKRPIIYYMYDFDYYKNNLRDFYISLDTLPGSIVKSEEDLYKEIDNIDKSFIKYKDKYKEFNKKYNYLDGKNTSKKVLKRVIEE